MLKGTTHKEVLHLKSLIPKIRKIPKTVKEPDPSQKAKTRLLKKLKPPKINRTVYFYIMPLNKRRNSAISESQLVVYLQLMVERVTGSSDPLLCAKEMICTILYHDRLGLSMRHKARTLFEKSKICTIADNLKQSILLLKDSKNEVALNSSLEKIYKEVLNSLKQSVFFNTDFVDPSVYSKLFKILCSGKTSCKITFKKVTLTSQTKLKPEAFYLNCDMLDLQEDLALLGLEEKAIALKKPFRVEYKGKKTIKKNEERP